MQEGSALFEVLHLYVDLALFDSDSDKAFELEQFDLCSPVRVTLSLRRLEGYEDCHTEMWVSRFCEAWDKFAKHLSSGGLFSGVNPRSIFILENNKSVEVHAQQLLGSHLNFYSHLSVRIALQVNL